MKTIKLKKVLYLCLKEVPISLLSYLVQKFPSPYIMQKAILLHSLELVNLYHILQTDTSVVCIILNSY